MSTYENSRKTLEKIRQEFGCAGDIIFRTAIQYVVEFGQRTFDDEEFLQAQFDRIDAKHNTAEAEGKSLYVGRRIEKACFECAAKIAMVDTYHLIIYIQKEFWVGNEGGIPYERAVKLLQNCMNLIDEDNRECGVTTSDTFDYLGFYDDEIEMLGFGYVIDVKEDEEDA